MSATIDRLRQLRVADIMTSATLTVSEASSLADVAEKLCAHGITGAPVVNAQGRVVGIISMSDLGRSCGQAHDSEEQFGLGRRHRLVKGPDDLSWSVEEVADDSIVAHMTRHVHFAQPQDSVIDCAQAMCTHHIHRMVVVDHEDRPVGIVSTLDIVASMVAAAEEPA